MKRLARNWPWVVLALVVAGATHIVTISAVPHFVMNRVLARFGPPNTIHHGHRANASSRAVVRPDPNLLYSVCPYDLKNGSLQVTSPVPDATYWSVSLFDADTNNYFVKNDRQAGKRVDFLVAAPGSTTTHGKLPVIHSPTMRGLVLFRTVINRQTRFRQLNKMRRQARCALTAHPTSQ